jgi:hypothetical protein
VREVLSEWVYEKVGHTHSKRVDHTLHRLDLLSKHLQLKVAVLPAEGDMIGSKVVVRSAGHVRIADRGPSEGNLPNSHSAIHETQ